MGHGQLSANQSAVSQFSADFDIAAPEMPAFAGIFWLWGLPEANREDRNSCESSGPSLKADVPVRYAPDRNILVETYAQQVLARIP